MGEEMESKGAMDGLILDGTWAAEGGLPAGGWEGTGLERGAHPRFGGDGSVILREIAASGAWEIKKNAGAWEVAASSERAGMAASSKCRRWPAEEGEPWR